MNKNMRVVTLVLFVAVLFAALSVFRPVSAEGEAEHVVRGGETLTGIARAYGLTLAQVLAANPSIADPNIIRAGQVIVLPAGRWEGPAVQPKRLIRWQVEADGTRIVKEDHLAYVHGGDNWIRMARKYNITVEALKAANPQIPPTADLIKAELIHIPVHLLGEGVYSFYETE